MADGGTAPAGPEQTAWELVAMATGGLGSETIAILEELEKGLKEKEIAERLSVATRTVSYHVRRAKDFFGVETLAGVIAEFVAWRESGES